MNHYYSVYYNANSHVLNDSNEYFVHLKYIAVGIISLVLLYLIVKQIIEHFTDDDDPVLMQIKHEISLVEPKVKNTIFHKGQKSYTINKKHVYMCLRDENDHYYDKNTLIYVALHELAHVLCNDVGHTENFKNIFSELLHRASDMGIYDFKTPIVPKYCEYNDKPK